MIDQDFCEFLEFEICKAFQLSDNEQVKGFWCDGVLLNQSDHSFSHKCVNDNKEIKFKAWIGNNGQTEYELILKLGNEAVSRISQNLDIKECVPNPDKLNWFVIDPKRNRLEIQLE